jgi:hypothetical protein
MYLETLVADTATLVRSPTLPPVALTIREMLAHNASAAVMQRVAGGPQNLQYILHTYLLPRRDYAPALPPVEPTRANTDPPVTPPVTRARARWEHRAEVLRLQLEGERRLRCIAGIVCDAFVVAFDALAGREMTADVVRARGAFCLLARAYTRCGVGRITGWIGRDHATMAYYRRHQRDWMGEWSYRERYTVAEAAIANRFCSTGRLQVFR